MKNSNNENLSKIEIVGFRVIKDIPGPKNWYGLKQFAKDETTGRLIEVGLACGFPLKKGFKIADSAFVEVVEYKSREQELRVLKTTSLILKQIHGLKVAKNELQDEYQIKLDELNKEYNDKHKVLDEAIENASFFSESILKIVNDGSFSPKKNKK